MSAARLTLHFHSWECGHHQQCPEPIAVQCPEHAIAILDAISHAISQPGSFRAVLVGETTYSDDIYVTDDYVDPRTLPPEEFWSERPVIVFGEEADRVALLAPEHAEALEYLYWHCDNLVHEPWDGKGGLTYADFVHTALTRTEIEAQKLDGLPLADVAVLVEASQLLKDVRTWGEVTTTPWTRDNERTFHILCLVSDHSVTAEVIAGWTNEECEQAEDWAGAVHLHASDNDDVVVPPKPAHVAAHPYRPNPNGGLWS